MEKAGEMIRSKCARCGVEMSTSSLVEDPLFKSYCHKCYIKVISRKKAEASIYQKAMDEFPDDEQLGNITKSFFSRLRELKDGEEM